MGAQHIKNREFKIGEMASFYGMTPRTLRFYEDRNILRPTRVDASSGYRFYGYDAIERLEVVSQLKKMGFSLEEIRGCVSGKLAVADQIEKRRLEVKMLNLEIKELEFMDTVAGKYEIDTVETPSVLTVSRDISAPSHGMLMEAFKGFIMEMISSGVKLRPFKRYFFEYAGGSVGRGEVRVRMHANVEACNGMPSEAKMFRGGRYLRTCHRGNWCGLWKANDILTEYAKSNGMKTSSPAIMTYVNGTFFSEDDAQNLTQLLLPVA